MDPDLLLEYAKKFQINPSIVYWAEISAIKIWRKIIFSRSAADFNMHENTVTQNLIYSFWELAITRVFPVQLYQAKNERANGNDIEIAIQTANGYLLFPSQAKIVNKKGNYPGIRHKVAGKLQIDRLLEYGNRVAGIPLYLFYNFGDNPERNEALENKYCLDVQRLGCSIFPAEFIKHNFYRTATNRWTIPDFYRIHHLLAIPFGNLFELINSNTIPGLNLGAYSAGAKFYSKDEITNKNYWRNLTPPPSIGRIPTQDHNRMSLPTFESEDNGFNPAFRVVFSIERENNTIIRMS
jgi:hypothetical protein